MEYGYLAIWWVVTSSIVAGQTPKYALVGESIELKTGITTPPDEILWKHDGDKVVEFDGSQQQPYGSYGNRVTLNWHSADLRIEHLTFEDSGLYELEVFRNKELSRTSYKIEVIDRVPKLIITCEMNRGSSSDGSEHQASLTCSAEERQSQSLLKFEWSSNGNVQSGRNLTISLGNEHDNVVYTCTVSNPLTTESAEFTAEECYPDEGSSAALVAGIIVPIILLGLAILFFMLWKKGYLIKKKEDLKEQSASNKETGNDGFRGPEGKPLLGRASTMPSNQPLRFPQRHHDHVELEDETEAGRDKPKQGHVKNARKMFEGPEPAGKSPAPESNDPEDTFHDAHESFLEESVNQISQQDKDRNSESFSLKAETQTPVLESQVISEGKNQDPKNSHRKSGINEVKPGHVKNTRKMFGSRGPAASYQNHHGNNKQLPDKEKKQETGDKNVIEGEKEKGSVQEALGHHGSQTNTDEEGRVSSPSPVTSEPDHKGKDEKAPDDENQHEAEEKTATEGDPSHSDEADESELAELDTHSLNTNKREEALSPASQYLPASSDQNHYGNNKQLPDKEKYQETGDKNVIEGEKENGSVQEALGRHGSQTNTDKEGGASSPSPVKSEPDHKGKDEKAPDDENQHEAEEKTATEGDPSHSDEAESAELDTHSSQTNTDEEGGTSSPSPVTSEPDHKGKDEKAPDDDDQHEAEEKTPTESDPSDSDEADESESVSSRNGDRGEESEPRLCSPS
ncbi:uncharacterized protein ACNS7B_024258 isoform 2-T2 [Menidia menidia]